MEKKSIAAIVVVVIVIVAAVAIYVSVGGDDEDDDSYVHAVSVDGVVADDENVLNGTYPIMRNLVLVTNGEPEGNVAALLSWITSEEGQAILGEEFVSLDESDYTTEIAPSEDGQTTIVMGGSTSLSEVATALAEAYMEKYPFMSISIQGGGSGVGESGCYSGDFDIGMLSRDLSDDYAQLGLQPVTIGQDGVAVIVNVEGVEDLTLEQLADIFSGEITNWSEVGGPDQTIRVVIREDGSGTRDCFDEAMESVDSDYVCTQDAVTCNATGTVISSVQDTAGSIGYISIGYLGEIEGDDGSDGEAEVHAVDLDGVVASEENVLNGTYPIQRNLVLVTNGEPTGNVAAFLSWITSAEGQAIIAEEFVSLDESDYTTEIAPSEDGQTTIVMGGSTSLSEVASALAEAYMEKYPFMSISIQGGGSGVGESGCYSGDFDIGMLSRDLSSSYEDSLVPVQIGRDGVAVIVNVEGVDELTMEQLAGIFSGEITNWSEVGGPDQTIRVVIREDGSGTRDCFDEAMESVDSDYVCTQDAVTCNATGTVISNVQNTAGSIGYISIGYLNDL